jgi:aldehyde dehydrogenase (NAD+)
MVASIKPHRDELGLGDGRMLIDGDWVTAADEATWSHVHPATGEQVAAFPVATPADVDRAVKAARRAFDEGPWPHARAGERVRVLRTIAAPAWSAAAAAPTATDSLTATSSRRPCSPTCPTT